MQTITNKNSYYEDNFNYYKFLYQFLLRSEFIGFGILTPFFAILGYFVLDISPIVSKKFFFIAFLTALLVIIYVSISLYFYLKPLKILIEFVYNNKNHNFTKQKKDQLLKTFFRMPLVRSIDVFVRTTTAIILFVLLINFYIEFDLYKIVVSITIFFIFSSSCGIIYYIFLDNLLTNIVNSYTFRNNFLLEEQENFYFIKFKYILSYILFLFLFLLSSIAGFIVSQFGNKTSKEFHRYNVQQTLVIYNDKINAFFNDIFYSILLSNKETIKQNLSDVFNNKIIKEKLSLYNYILDFGLYDKQNNTLESINKKIPAYKENLLTGKENNNNEKNLIILKSEPNILVYTIHSDLYNYIFFFR